MAASVSATDSQGMDVGLDTEMSVILDSKHGISLGEHFGLDSQRSWLKRRA